MNANTMKPSKDAGLKQATAVLRCIFLILLLCLPHDANAVDLYVSNQGSDENRGTRERPFRTLTHAAAQARAGDTVVIRGGIYRETLTFRHSGTEIKPLTFIAAKGEKVVISGADLVGDWKPYKEAILQATIQKELELGFNQVFIDGRMIPLARFPNETSEDLFMPTLIDMKADQGQITSPLLTQPENFWKGGFVVGRIGHGWTFQCATIEDSKQGKLSISGKSGPWFAGDGVGYLAGVLGALDAPGEWHIENGTLYLWPPDGTDIAKAQVEVKQRAHCVDFNGQSHVAIQGVEITAGTVRLVGDANLLADCIISYPSHFTRFAWSGYSSDGGAEAGHNGILVEGDNNTIHSCTIRFSAGSGVVIKGRRNRITRCEISDINYSGTYSCPITLQTAKDKAYGENRIWFNTIRRAGRDCIQMYGAKADDIRYNDISEAGLICKDLGMIYVWGRDGMGTRIAYNWIHDNRGKGPNPGIYLDNFCRNFVVDHNVIWNLEAGVRVNGPAEGHRIYNNTLFHCGDVGTSTFMSWAPDEHLKADWPKNVYQYDKANNLFLGNDPDKELTNAPKNEFWPKPDSEAIDAGNPIPGFTDGFLGKAPDLGAYESAGPKWIPGKNGKAESASNRD